MSLPEVPTQLISLLRPFFQARDRDYIPADRRAVVLQAGLTEDRPTTPLRDGHAYYSTDDDTLYVGDGGAWVAV